MVLWFIDVNIFDFVSTFLISMGIIAMSILIFSKIWLPIIHDKIPIEYFTNQYVFDSSANFYTKMKTLILDIDNHDYWIMHIGFDGFIKRVLLSPLSTLYWENAFFLFHHFRSHLPNILLSGAHYVNRLHRK